MILPIAPLRDVVIFPGQVIGLSFGRNFSRAAIETAEARDRQILILAQKDPFKEVPESRDLYQIGTLVTIRQVLRTDLDIKVLVEGVSRVKIEKFTQAKPYLTASFQVLEEPKVELKEPNIAALRNSLVELFKKFVNLGKQIPMDIVISILSAETPGRVADLIAGQLEASVPEKQAILEEMDILKRLQKTFELLGKVIQVSELQEKLASQTRERLGEAQKEVFLREQLKTIQKELGEAEGSELDELAKKIQAAGMSPEVKAKAEKELSRLRSMPSFSPEVSYIRTYLDWLVNLPWSKKSESKTNIKGSEKILEEDHYGLKKIKERVLEYLAVHQLVGKIKGPILCFVGPPGVGKTSIGKSIARALGRKFVRMSLGGIRDEAEIRGHRRTYVGALPGRIIQGINTAATKNPVFMLDEIDKVGVDFRGDPSAALLEALDPEQNFNFSDHYLEVPFDLSDVMFITTANILDTIPPALRDRMEVIEFPGYTDEEKLQIAKHYLWSKQLEFHGLKGKLDVADYVISEIISGYTREAGVRELERELAAICRKVAKSIAEGTKFPKEISKDQMAKFLGPRKFEPWVVEVTDQVGAVAALAVTPAGGEVLSVESSLMPGKGNLILTGQLGDVMKESAQAALSFAKAWVTRNHKTDSFDKETDFHVHVPSGAIPKDGPSAGVAITISLVSAITKKPVRREIGMTGEVTLRGRVMRIGGLKEKVLAAHRSGLRTVILPAENKPDLEEIPAKTRKELKFIFVKEMNQVLKEALKQ